LHGAMLQTEAAVRPYGMGTALAIVVFAGVWRVASAPGVAAMVVTGAAAILAVNTLYQNAALLAAFCLAAACARAVDCDRRGIVRVGVVALFGAAALVPYAAILTGSRDWRVVVYADNTAGQLASRFVTIASDWSRPLLVVWCV